MSGFGYIIFWNFGFFIYRMVMVSFILRVVFRIWYLIRLVKFKFYIVFVLVVYILSLILRIKLYYKILFFFEN